MHSAIPKEKVKQTLQLLARQHIEQNVVFNLQIQIKRIEIAQLTAPCNIAEVAHEHGFNHLGYETAGGSLIIRFFMIIK